MDLKLLLRIGLPRDEYNGLNTAAVYDLDQDSGTL